MPYFGIPIRNGLPIGLGSVAGFGIAPFEPYSLFENGEQGAWYDPNDFSTLFTDSAGTTPVTGVEQFVGLMLDKSGRGNHAFQTTSAKRPKLAARYNLLEYTEQIDNGYWGKVDSSITADATTAPDGANTADLLIENAASGRHMFLRAVQTVANVVYTASVYVKNNTRRYLTVLLKNSAGASPRYSATFDSILGTVVSTSSAGAPSNTANSITSVGGGWWRVTVSMLAASTSTNLEIGLSNSATPAYSESMPTYTGDGTSGIYIWGADLRPASQATGLIGPTYQRVAAATVYDTAGFLPYLAFDGLSWSMGTNSIDFSAGDKVTAWAGVRKLSDAATAIVAELSAITDGNTGTFYITAPSSSGAIKFRFSSKGTLEGLAGTTSTSYNAPITAIQTGIGNISGDSALLRLNGTQVGSDTADQGTGNYGNYPLFIGARNNASLFFNGWLTSLIIRGAQSTQSQIEATEAWVNGKTGAY
jgi:hypothetical protein